jgi:hypothetical protein
LILIKAHQVTVPVSTQRDTPAKGSQLLSDGLISRIDGSSLKSVRSHA